MSSTLERRAQELLVERATQGLSSVHERELETLLAGSPQWRHNGFELAAAAIELAFAGSLTAALPTALRRRLEHDAEIFFVGAESRRLVPPSKPQAAAQIPAFPRHRGHLAWMAVAASLIVVMASWWPRLQISPIPTSRPPSVSQLRLRLLDTDDVIERRWQATPDAAALQASGDVVWSNVRQQGFLRIRGLIANDPQVEQYQLWIFDRLHDERYPIDGGVFDIDAQAPEVIVPIDAKIAVGEPYLFAVTVEPAGGVVVSSRERIVLAAEV